MWEKITKTPAIFNARARNLRPLFRSSPSLFLQIDFMKSLIPARFGFFLAALCLFPAALPLEAQVYEKNNPRELSPPPPEVSFPDDKPRPGRFKGDTKKVLVNKTRLLVFVPGLPDQGVPTLPADLPDSGIFIHDLPFIDTPAFRELMQPFIGRPITLEHIENLLNAVIIYYRDHDRRFVDIYPPEQDITDGVLHIAVIDAVIGEVRFEGNRYFKTPLLLKKLRLGSGDHIDADILNEDIDLLGRNPFRQMQVISTPGADFGATDLIFRSQDRFPVFAYAGYDNTGTELTGLSRWQVGGQWGNAFGRDDLFSYQFGTSGELDGLATHAFNYRTFLPWRHQLSFYGAYSDNETEFGDTIISGSNYEAGLRYELPLKKFEKVDHALQFSVEFKHSDNYLELARVGPFGPLSALPVDDTDDDIIQGVLSYQASRPDA